MEGYKKFLQVGIALDPIHVGAGGAQIGRVDLTIVRDPVTQVPKIPGSSLAGVYRTYVAMAYEEGRQASQSGQQSQGRQKPYYPDCAGLGLDQNRGHCRQPDCPVCTVFGFARGAGQEGGFAGLAAFTDAHVLLFPVPTWKGPMWVTAPMALKMIVPELEEVNDNAVYVEKADRPLNLGWLLLETKEYNQDEINRVKTQLAKLSIPRYIQDRLALVPDHLFAHIVNSNLEVRTSVSINPATGAAEDRALFSYEALPRNTVLVWEIIAKNPAYFQISGQPITVDSNRDPNPDDVHKVTTKAHPYLEHLGIGGMGTRGMGRVRVVYSGSDSGTGAQQSQAQSVNPTSPANQGGGQP